MSHASPPSPARRDASLRRLRRLNRGLATGMVALTVFLANAAARAFPGHAKAAPPQSHSATAATRRHERTERARRAARARRRHHRVVPATSATTTTSTSAPAAPPSPPAAAPQAAPAPPAAPAPVVSGGS